MIVWDYQTIVMATSPTVDAPHLAPDAEERIRNLMGQLFHDAGAGVSDPLAGCARTIRPLISDRGVPVEAER